MAIKRGVSFYSYQQAQFFGEMNWKDMCKELHDNLHCDGVEIINEATVPGYPFPSKEFIGDWNNTMARYNLQPVAFDGFLDTMRFRDHVLNHREASELLKLDLQLAHDMGFKHIRTMTGLPTDVLRARWIQQKSWMSVLHGKSIFRFRSDLILPSKVCFVKDPVLQ